MSCWSLPPYTAANLSGGTAIELVQRRIDSVYPTFSATNRTNAFLLTMGIALAQSVTGLAQDQPKPALDAKFIGIGGCQICHTMPTDAYVAAGSTKWVRMTEFPQWNGSDKHAKAFELLTKERGQQIGRALWKDPDVTRRHECISCHCNWSKESHKPEQFVRRRERRIRIEQGSHVRVVPWPRFASTRKSTRLPSGG